MSTWHLQSPVSNRGNEGSRANTGVRVQEKTLGVRIPEQTPGNEGLEQALVSPPLPAICTWSRVAGDHLTAQPNTRDQRS